MEAKAVISEIEMEIAVDRSEMIQQLHDRNCKVIFRKVDGTERTMICTLNEGAIDNGDVAKREVKSRNDNVIAVWDVENKGWRSFRVDSVLSFT
mgnify:FL=1|tara:strand:- start:3143 stop:3424 length:282 start_codon:yes stop_codon:yes gene_type:complete